MIQLVALVIMNFLEYLHAVEDYKNALIYAKKAKNLDNENYWYYKNMIEIQILIKDFVEAKKNEEKMINANIAKIDDLLNYANILFWLNKINKAINVLNNIEEKYGVSENISMNKYKYYLSENKFSDAENEIKKLMSIDENKIELYGILAELYTIQNKDSEALKWYNKLLKIRSLQY